MFFSVYCYLEFELRYLKNLKLFLIKGYLSLYGSFAKIRRRVLLFLKAFSWETDLWVTLGDFTVKKMQNLEEKFVFN